MHWSKLKSHCFNQNVFLHSQPNRSVNQTMKHFLLTDKMHTIFFQNSWTLFLIHTPPLAKHICSIFFSFKALWTRLCWLCRLHEKFRKSNFSIDPCLLATEKTKNKQVITVGAVPKEEKWWLTCTCVLYNSWMSKLSIFRCSFSLQSSHVVMASRFVPNRKKSTTHWLVCLDVIVGESCC